MGLLGLIATFFTCGNLIKDNMKDASFDFKSKQDAICNEKRIWMDSHGNDYLVSTGEKVFRHDDKLLSVKTGEVIFDYKDERIKKYNNLEIINAKNDCKKYVLLKYIEYDSRLYYTELSTMKRYYLKAIQSSDNKITYVKYYYQNGKLGIDILNDESQEITKKEFDSLYGSYLTKEYLPYSKECGIHYTFEKKRRR